MKKIIAVCLFWLLFIPLKAQLFPDEDDSTEVVSKKPVDPFFSRKSNVFVTAEWLIPGKKTFLYYRPDPSHAPPNGSYDAYSLYHVTKPLLIRTEYRDLVSFSACYSHKLGAEIHLFGGFSVTQGRFTRQSWCDSLYINGYWASNEYFVSDEKWLAFEFGIECRINKYAFITLASTPAFCRMIHTQQTVGGPYAASTYIVTRETNWGFENVPVSIGVNLNLFNSNRIYLSLAALCNGFLVDRNSIFYSSGLRIFIL
jgi:hypothetical protein